MRHKVDGRLFGRTANQRKALLKGIVTSLFENQRIETTVAKAKEARRIAERMITFGIKGDLHSKRQVFSYISDRNVASKLFSEIAPRFVGRNGGYLRLIQTRNRLKDSAPMAILEFIDYESIKQPKGKAKKEAKAAKSEKAEKPAPSEKEAKPAKSKKAAKPEKSEKKAKPAKTVKSEKTEKKAKKEKE
ncbi:MAG: 50S ribosomal protein L17 [Nitrospirae bacterium GWC2_42_7]|nr:MAG: 50S ribosomal protein L17 [Nitrospirae bacterium GWC2_42_7]